MKLAIPLLVTALVSFCGSEAADGPDGGIRGGPDAGGTDAGTGPVLGTDGAVDGGPALSDGGTTSPPPLGEYDEAFEDAANADAARAACLDGVDNDGDGLFDCQDASCQRNVPSCCVGESGSTCCALGDETTLPIDTCTGDLSLCPDAAGLVLFGPANVTVETRGDDAMPTLAATDDDADVGVAMPARLDPRAGAIHLRASIVVPTDAPEGVDAIGFALVDHALSPGALARVTPIAGVLVSRNHARVSLMLAGEPFASWPAPADGAPHRYDLVLHPGGRLEVLVDDESKETAEVDFDGALRAVLYGRVTNPGAPSGPTRAGQFGVTVDVCDMPAALVRAPETAVPAPSSSPTGWADGRRVGAPSVVTFERGTRMALEVDGDLYLAEPRTDGFHLLSAPGAPILSETSAPFGQDGVSDPALFVGDEGLELWFTAWQGEVGTIARVQESGADTFDTETVEVVLDPGEAEDVASFGQSAPFRLFGRVYAAVREHPLEGPPRIAVWDLGAEIPSRVGVVRAPASGDLFAFDRDEVGAPGVLVSGGVARLYYAGRRGTRWSIGLVVSDDAVAWRPLEDVVLRPSAIGYDALGATDPSPVVIDDTLHLYFTGHDGVTTRIGVASGPAPAS